MPAKGKTQWAQLKVGLLAIAALTIFATLIVLMSGSQGFFKTSVPMVMYLDDSAAVAVGAPVRLNGILVGRVSKVSLSGLDDPMRTVRIEMQIQTEFLPSIPSDSEAAMAQETLLSTKFVNIKRGKSPQAVTPGAEIKARQIDDFNDIIAQGTSTLQALEGVVKKLNDIASQVELGKGNLGKLFVDETLYSEFLDSVREVKKIIVAVNEGKGNLGKALNDDQLYEDVKTAVARTNKLLDDVDQGQGTVGRLVQDRKLYDEGVKLIEDTRGAIADTRHLLAELNAGKGTAGRLLKSNEFADQLKASISRLDSIMDKLNQGQGTLGQLLVNPSLYESLDGTSREMNGLMKDFRTNPKKFLSIKLHIF